MNHAESLASRTRLLVLDCDGVLTDGGLYYDESGLCMKRFNVQDGLGIKIAQAAGLEVAVITGLDQPPVERRVRELGIKHYYPGNHEKVPLFMEICENVGVKPEESAFMGDDWVDAAVMKVAGFAMAVPNAQPEILEMADWISDRRGGDGAVREGINFILRHRGLLDEQWKRWAD